VNHRELISRQLDLFAADEGDLLAEVYELRERYNRAARDEAEEAYGDYADSVESVKEALADMRDAFAATLDDAEEYERAFEAAARKRWRWLDDG